MSVYLGTHTVSRPIILYACIGSQNFDVVEAFHFVNNYRVHYRRRSDKRPLAPSNASTLTYDTVPVDTDHKEATTPQVQENAKGNQCELEAPNKQQSTEATPIYEIQYEPVEINNGLCVIPEEGERLNDVEQCKLGTTETNSGTISSHHSYEIVKDRRDAILEASSESLLDNQHEIGMDDRVLQQGGITKSADSEGANGGATTAKKNFRGTKNIMYENVTISMSPDVSIG